MTKGTIKFRSKDVELKFYEGILNHCCIAKINLENLSFEGTGFTSDMQQAQANALKRLDEILQNHADGHVVEQHENNVKHSIKLLEKAKQTQEVVKWFLNFTKGQS